MFQIFSAVNGCRTQCFWLSSSLQVCWAHRILRISPTTMIFACPSFKNHGSAKSGSLQDVDPFQNPIGPLYRWGDEYWHPNESGYQQFNQLKLFIKYFEGPNLPSIREYPSLSWCHFEYLLRLLTLIFCTGYSNNPTTRKINFGPSTRMITSFLP